MVDVISYLVEIRTHFIFVCKCSFLVVFKVVGYFSRFGHFTDQYFNGGHPVGDLTNQLFTVGAQHFVFFGREDFLYSAKIFEQAILISHGSRHDVVDSEVAQYTAFNLNLHGVFLQFHFQTAVQLRFVENAFADKYGFGLIVNVVHQSFRDVADVGQSAACSFLFPFFGIAVAFETDRFGSDDCLFQQTEDSFVFAYSFLHKLFHRCAEFVQLVCHGSIDSNHGGGTVGRRTCGTELKPVSGEGERGGTVTVGCVEQNFGYTSDTQFQRCLFFRGHFLVSHLAYNFVKSCRKL